MIDAPEQPDDQHQTDLAVRYVEMCVRKWLERGLEAPYLSAAMLSWSVSHAVSTTDAAHVAEGLQTVADSLMIDGEPAAPSRLI